MFNLKKLKKRKEEEKEKKVEDKPSKLKKIKEQLFKKKKKEEDQIKRELEEKKSFKMFNLRNLFKKKQEQKRKPRIEYLKKRKEEEKEKKVEDKPSKLKKIKEQLFKKKKPEKEPRIEYLKKQLKKRQIKRVRLQQRKHRLRFYIEKAGLDIHPKVLSKRLFNVSIAINLAISFYLIYYFSINFGFTWVKIATAMLSLWIFVFIILLFVMWVFFYLSMDLKIFKRRLDIEDVLPDFLQLTASNIKAGMTIDRALWYAVRPRFGVLAKEIETVAKETMSGKDLKDALQDFTAKYNSPILKRSISLLIEGIEAGGEIGSLLIRIASNIQETKTMKREMSANVTTYVIFISFSTVVAAPFLFALSGILIQVIQGLSSALGGVGTTSTNIGLALSFRGTGVSYNDFRIFAIVILIITSFFSSSMIATIKKGDIKAGFKYIPIFIISALTIYLIVQSILNNLLVIFF